MEEIGQNLQVRFIDRGDWPQAFVCLTFLIVFPVAIVAMWNEPREVAPLKYLVPFAALFALGLPFLLKQVVSARTRELLVDSQKGQITLLTWYPYQKSTEVFRPHLVNKLVFETTVDDGYWYCAKLVLRNSRKIVFAQGSHEPHVRAELAKMTAVLVHAKPDLHIEDIRK